MTQYVVRYFSLSYFAMINKGSVTMAGVASVEINFNLLRVVQILQTKLTSCFSWAWLRSGCCLCLLTVGARWLKAEMFVTKLRSSKLSSARLPRLSWSPGDSTHAQTCAGLWCKNIGNTQSWLVFPALLTNTNDRLVRINDHIIPGLARQVTVSVLRFICVDLKILTTLFGIFLQYQLNCYWLDHKTCWTCTVTQHTSHLTDYAMDRTGHHSFQWKLLSG